MLALAMYIAAQFTYSLEEPTNAYSAGAAQNEPTAVVNSGASIPTDIDHRPSVKVGDSTIGIGGTESVPVVLSAAPTGVSGYIFELTLDDPTVARITGVEFPEFGLAAQAMGDGSRMRIAAADLSRLVEVGAIDSLMAEVVIEGLAPGTSSVLISVLIMDDDAGDPLVPGTSAGAVTVY